MVARSALRLAVICLAWRASVQPAASVSLQRKTGLLEEIVLIAGLMVQQRHGGLVFQDWHGLQRLSQHLTHAWHRPVHACDSPTMIAQLVDGLHHGIGFHAAAQVGTQRLRCT